jgi:hypothetical protein
MTKEKGKGLEKEKEGKEEASPCRLRLTSSAIRIPLYNLDDCPRVT